MKFQGVPPVKLFDSSSLSHPKINSANKKPKIANFVFILSPVLILNLAQVMCPLNMKAEKGVDVNRILKIISLIILNFSLPKWYNACAHAAYRKADVVFRRPGNRTFTDVQSVFAAGMFRNSEACISQFRITMV